MKEALDDYDGGTVVPAFQLQLKMIPSLTPTALVQRVGFVGVTPENSFITITKEPKTEGINLPFYKSYLIHHLFYSRFVYSAQGRGSWLFFSDIQSNCYSLPKP